MAPTNETQTDLLLGRIEVTLGHILTLLEARFEREAIQCEIPKDRAHALAEQERLYPTKAPAAPAATVTAPAAAPACVTGPALKAAVAAELPLVPTIDELMRIYPKSSMGDSETAHRSGLEMLIQWLDSARKPNGSVDHLKAAAQCIKGLLDGTIGKERAAARMAAVGYPRSAKEGLPTVAHMAAVLRSDL